MWCTSHQRGGRSQPGNAQPPSRMRMADRWAPVNKRRVRPASSGIDAVPSTRGRIWASQARRRAADAERVSPVSRIPGPSWRVSESNWTVTLSCGGWPPLAGSSSVRSAAGTPRRVRPPAGLRSSVRHGPPVGRLPGRSRQRQPDMPEAYRISASSKVPELPGWWPLIRCRRCLASVPARHHPG